MEETSILKQYLNSGRVKDEYTIPTRRGETAMTCVRAPVAAGSFYPADPAELTSVLQTYLRRGEARVNASAQKTPKAIIAPHAGYRYSGEVAASAYALLKPARELVSRVVLIGPAHRFPVTGLALPVESSFATPLGDLSVDTAAVARIAGFDFVNVVSEAHHFEHALEVHLPFLQQVLSSFSIVPLLAGDVTPAEVRELLDCLWGGAETLFVISSDLSHFHDRRTATHIDAQTSAAIERLDADGVGAGQACGCMPIRGLLMAAGDRKLKARIVDVRNSGDTAGGTGEVVGYGAYVFSEAGEGNGSA